MYFSSRLVHADKIQVEQAISLAEGKSFLETTGSNVYVNRSFWIELQHSRALKETTSTWSETDLAIRFTTMSKIQMHA